MCLIGHKTIILAIITHSLSLRTKEDELKESRLREELKTIDGLIRKAKKQALVLIDSALYIYEYMMHVHGSCTVAHILNGTLFCCCNHKLQVLW